MSCESRLDDIALYVYGELTPEDEEKLEAHADGCADCTREITRVREVGRALDRRSLDATASLLAECRQEIMIAVHSQPAAGGLWQGLRGVFSSWLAGAGVKPGITYGESDEYGIEVAKDMVHFHDFHATILHLLGIDHLRLTYRHAGRDFRLTDVAGQVVKPILA